MAKSNEDPKRIIVEAPVQLAEDGWQSIDVYPYDHKGGQATIMVYRDKRGHLTVDVHPSAEVEVVIQPPTHAADRPAHKVQTWGDCLIVGFGEPYGEVKRELIAMSERFVLEVRKEVK